MTADRCAEMHLLLQAELDGELDAAGAASIAAHVEDCAGCSAFQAELGALSTLLRAGLTRHAAPASLRAALSPRQPAPGAAWKWWPAWRHGLSFGAGLAAAGIAAFIVLPDRGTEVPDIVAAHIRALQPGHLVDVASTNQHTVKPWFDGRLDYAPPVRDLAAQGFPLVGGRLDYLADRTVAALVYRHDRHLIDVFVRPGNRPEAGGVAKGYHVMGWTRDGMSYRAVSDLNARELADFARLMRTLE